MKLYHGSKDRLEYLEPRQASSDVVVPEGELRRGIYLTPDYGFAVAMAARPENSRTDVDEKTMKITFERPELFDPESDIFIYSFDSEELPTDNVQYIDEWQYVVTDIARLVPDTAEQAKASKVLEYYEITNWRERETPTEMKFR